MSLPPYLNWHVYIVRCADGTLYTGVSNSVLERVLKHNSGKGAKYTRPISKRPVVLKWAKACSSRSAALRLEAKIKKLSKKQKEEML
jgi:putative endonuclease